jgi:hypothetical protein
MHLSRSMIEQQPWVADAERIAPDRTCVAAPNFTAATLGFTRPSD